MGSPGPLVLLIALAAIAISGSKKKLRASAIIVGSCALGLAIGFGFGLLTDNMGAGGSIAGVATLVLGGGMAVSQIIANKKANQPKLTA